MPISRFPRRGYPLAPTLLREWLNVPIAHTLRRYFHQKVTLADLDASTWQRCPESVCAALAEDVLEQLVAQRQSIIADGDRMKLPILPNTLKLAELELESRTLNCLRKGGYVRNLQGLSNASLSDLLALKGFGTKCLVDLLTS